MATIDTVSNISTLKGLPIPLHNTTVYVEGYYNPGDAGGGMFRYDENSETQPDLGINFIPDTIISEPGRWVRQYYGNLNVAYFGIVKHLFETPSGEANHERLQNAIDYCHRNSDPVGIAPPPPYVDDTTRGYFTIYFPSGVYWMQPDTSIILRSRTHLMGDTTSTIRLHHVSIDYLFKIDTGFINWLCIEKLRFNLGAEIDSRRANPTGWLHAKATETLDGDRSGGIYGATINDVHVENVGNHGIHFEGGEFAEENWDRKCNQFVYLENVWVERKYDYLNSFRLTGLNVNISFNNCNPTMPTFAQSLPTVLGSAWYVDSVLPHAPGNNISILFKGCDAGGAPGRPGEFGFIIKNAQNVFIENCWIEDSEFGIFVQNSKAISILDTHFANAAANGSLPDSMYPTREAACILIENSAVNIERNHVSITDPEVPNVCNERFIIGIGENNIINSSNNYFHSEVLSQTYGIHQFTKIQLITANFLNTLPATPPPVPPVNIYGIDINSKKMVLVRLGSEDERDIYRINSRITGGETLYLFAENGDITFHAMGLPEWDGKNIALSGATTFTLQHGHGATFIKIDRINGHETAIYQLMSTF